MFNSFNNLRESDDDLVPVSYEVFTWMYMSDRTAVNFLYYPPTEFYVKGKKEHPRLVHDYFKQNKIEPLVAENVMIKGVWFPTKRIIVWYHTYNKRLMIHRIPPSFIRREVLTHFGFKPLEEWILE